MAAGLWMFGVIDFGSPSALAQNPKPAASAGTAPSPSASPKTERTNGGDGLLVQSTNTAFLTEGAKKWLNELAKVSLQPQELFSLDEWVKSTAEKEKLDKQQEDISHIAGLLYEAALRGGLSIGERHTHQDLPAYASPGFDVVYQENTRNLTLSNPYSFAMQIGAVTADHTPPAVYFKGSPDGKWAPVNLEVAVEPVQPEKVEMVDFTLGAGKGETLRREGKKGMLILVKAKEGELTRVITKDYYAPLDAVVARGPTAEELKESGGQ